MEDVEAGSRFVNQAGSTMKDIVQSVQKVTQIMDEITRESNGQAVEINAIAGAVREVDNSTQQNAAMVEEISAAVMSLEERANYLSESVKTFRVDLTTSPATALLGY